MTLYVNGSQCGLGEVNSQRKAVNGRESVVRGDKE